MILPNQPPSSRNGEEHPPPSYQDSVPPSQLTPSERPTASLYAPPVSSRSGPPHENERGVTPLNSLDEKSPGVGFPEPAFSTGRTHSEPPPLPPKDKEKEELKGGPAQRAFGAFSSVWGASNTASTSRVPNPAGSTSNTLVPQDPLNPAPPAFTRPTPKSYAYLPFQPMTMLGIGSNLADGFPMIPPPINPEDERQVGKANPQHPFVSHDVTEEDWLGFLAGLKAVASGLGQAQKSFLAKIFLGETSERDQRKNVVHFVDSWNHYFFHPRRLTIALARGRRIFNGASGNHHLHRRHSFDGQRGRGDDPSHKGGHRHRSYSTDSSSSSSSSDSSDSSVRSATSDPREMPVPHTQTHYGFQEGIGGIVPGINRALDCSGIRRGVGGLVPEINRALGRGQGGPGGHFGGPSYPGWHGGRGGRGWCSPGLSAPGVGDGSLGRGGPWESHAYRDQKRAWRYEKRAAKREYRRNKRAMKYEWRARKREAKADRYLGAKNTHKRDQPWKLIITFHGALNDSGQS